MCFSRIFTIKIQPLLCIAAEQQLHGKIGKTDCEAPAASIQKKCNTIFISHKTCARTRFSGLFKLFRNMFFKKI